MTGGWIGYGHWYKVGLTEAPPAATVHPWFYTRRHVIGMWLSVLAAGLLGG